MPRSFKRISKSAAAALPAQAPLTAGGTRVAPPARRRAADAELIPGPLLVEKHDWRMPLGRRQSQLLAHRLTALRLPNFLSEHDRLTRGGGEAAIDPRDYLLHLAAHETAARDQRRAARLVRAAGFPAGRNPDEFDLSRLPAPCRALVRELAEGGFVGRGENIVVLGGAGSGKTRVATAMGFAACRSGASVRYTTAATLVAELNAAVDERRLLRFHRQLDSVNLLIIDDLGPAPLPPASAALLFEVFSHRAERQSTLVASSLAPEGWDRVFGTARLAEAVIERLARRAHRVDLGEPAEPAVWLPKRPFDESVWQEGPRGDHAAAAHDALIAPAAAPAVLYG